MKNISLSFATLTFGVLIGLSAQAEETGQPHTLHETEAHHRNKIELGISNTHTEHDDNAFTLSASYNYHFSELVSVGVLGEFAFGDLDAGIVGIPLKLYPGGNWVLTAMPGIEIHHGHKKNLFRLGVGYEFEMEKYSIMPEISADYVDDEVNIIIGLVFGFGF